MCLYDYTTCITHLGLDHHFRAGREGGGGLEPPEP